METRLGELRSEIFRPMKICGGEIVGIFRIVAVPTVEQIPIAYSDEGWIIEREMLEDNPLHAALSFKDACEYLLPAAATASPHRRQIPSAIASDRASSGPDYSAPAKKAANRFPRFSYEPSFMAKLLLRDRRQIARPACCACADNARAFETTLPSATARLAPVDGRRRRQHCSRDSG